MGASRLNITNYPKGQILMVRKEATETGRTSKITVEERYSDKISKDNAAIYGTNTGVGTGYNPQCEMRKLTDKDMDDMIKAAADRTGAHLYSRKFYQSKNN